MCHGGGRQSPKRRWSHDVKYSNTGAIRDVVTSDVVGNDEYWRRPCSVSCGRSSEVIHDSEGAACGQIHGSDGPVAPSVGSGCSWAITDIDLRILYEMRLLFWQKRTTCPVATCVLTLLLSNKTLLTHGPMS